MIEIGKVKMWSRLAMVVAALTIGVAASGFTPSHSLSSAREMSTDPGVHTLETFDLGCYEVAISFSTNGSTQSVGMRYQVWDSAGTQIIQGWSTMQVQNFTPGSSNNGFFVTAPGPGYSILFSLHPYSGPNGTGTLGPAPKFGPQYASSCT